MKLPDFLKEAAELRNAYWFIRSQRSVGKRRKYYRRAAKEKGRLRGLGYHPEVIRLYGLHLRDTTREHRLYRFLEAFEEAANGPKQLSLF